MSTKLHGITPHISSDESRPSELHISQTVNINLMIRRESPFRRHESKWGSEKTALHISNFGNGELSGKFHVPTSLHPGNSSVANEYQPA